jgi:hypothetical protein
LLLSFCSQEIIATAQQLEPQIIGAGEGKRWANFRSNGGCSGPDFATESVTSEERVVDVHGEIIAEGGR